MNPMHDHSLSKLIRHQHLRPWALAWALLATVAACNQADPDDGTQPTDSSAGGDTDQEPGAGGDTDQDPGAGGDTDQDPGTGGETGQDPGTGGDTGQDPGTGGDTGETTDPIDPPDDPTLSAPEEYFPLAAGSRWSYHHVHRTRGEWLEEVTMSETTFDGEFAYLVEDSPDLNGEISVQTWQQLGTEITRVYREQKRSNVVLLEVSYDPGFLRFDTAWNAPGVVTRNTYRRAETKPDGSTSQAIREQVFTVLSIDASVSVEAGDFENCLLVERVRSDNGDRTQFWYARGVGKVREEDPVSRNFEELVDYSIGAR